MKPAALILGLTLVTTAWARDLQWAPLHEPSAGGWITSLSVSPHDHNRVLVGGDILGIGLSEDRGESWHGAFGLKNWEIADFTWHPTDTNTVWVGTMGGLYVSHDAGRNWIEVREGFPPATAGMYSTPIQKVLFDPSDASTLLAFGGNHREFPSPGTPDWGAVWRSVDSGLTWKRIGSVSPGGNVMAASFAAGSSTKLFAAVNGAGVFASEDGGQIWALRSAGLPHLETKDLVVHPTQSDTLFVALWNHPTGGGAYNSGGIWWTTNAGQSWTPRNSGIRQNTGTTDYFVTRMEALALSPANPQRMVTSDVAYDNAGILITGNGGASWSKKAITPVFTSSGANYTGLSADPTDPNTFYAYQSEYCVRTTNNGATWTDITSYRPLGSAGVRGRGYAGWVCTGFAWHPIDPQRSTFTALDHGFGHQSRDGLTTWSRGASLPQYNGAYGVAWTTNDTIYLNCGQFGGFSGVARSRDGGANFTMLKGATNGLPDSGQPTGIYSPPGDPTQVWAVVGGKLWHSGSGGDHWTNQPCGVNPQWIAADAHDPFNIYITAADAVYVSRQGNTGFAKMTGSPANGQRLAVDSLGRVYVLPWRAANGGLWRLTGGQWKRLNPDKYLACVAIDPRDPRRMMAGSLDDPYHDEQYASGIWTSEDDGATWRQQNTGLAQLRVECIAVSPHDPDLWVLGTEGRGFFVTRWGDVQLRQQSTKNPPSWRVLGPIELTARLESTSDLGIWTPFATNALPAQGWLFTSDEAGPRAFYRAVLSP